MKNKNKQKKTDPDFLPAGSSHHFEPMGRRRLYFIFGAFLGLGDLLLASSLLALPSGEAAGAFSWAIVAMSMFCAIWLMATARRRRLTFTPRALVLRSAFGTKAIARSGIDRSLESTSQGLWTMYFYEKGKKRAFASIPFVFEEKDAIRAWARGSCQT
jgi:uncharacterized protein (DUF58 family)